MFRDMISQIKNQFGLVASLNGSSDNTSDIDLQGYTRANIVALFSGGGSSGDEVTIKLEHKEEGGSYENVIADDLLMDYGSNDGSVSSGVFATVAGDAADVLFSVGYIGGKRFVKVTAEQTGGTSDDLVGVAVMKEPLQKPESD